VVGSAAVAFGSDVVLVGLLAGPGPAAAYAVASRAATFARDISFSASDVLLPSFSNAVAREDSERLRRLFKSAVFLGLFVSIPLAIIFVSLGRPLLVFWLSNVPPNAQQALACLGLLIVLQMPGRIASQLLMGAQRSNLLLRFFAPMALLNLAISVPMTLWLGVAGPAIGSAVAVLLIDPLLVRRVGREYLHMGAWDIYKSPIATLGPPTAITACAALVVGSTVRLHPVASPLLAAGVMALFALSTVLWLRMSHQGSSVAGMLKPVPRVGKRLERLLVGRASAAEEASPSA
jgi:O-antigen/teichoic acid export membrane protein